MLKGIAVHPYQTGELARLRAQDIAREAAAHHHHSIRRPASTPAGFLFGVSVRHAITARRADAGFWHARIKERIGLALIRAGMRYVDPISQLRRAPR